MNVEFLKSVESLLSGCKIQQALALTRTWLAGASAGEPEELLAQCPARLKPRLTLLLRDLLCRYPHTLVGAPAVMYFKADSPGKGEQARKLRLPHPDPETVEPCKALHFLGWLNPRTQLPLETPFRPERHEIFLPSNTMQVAVALFKCSPEVFHLEGIDLPTAWWARLFEHSEGSVHVSSRVVQPYPDALETARELLKGATGAAEPVENHFINDTTAEWARGSGALFRESCRRQYPLQVL